MRGRGGLALAGVVLGVVALVAAGCSSNSGNGGSSSGGSGEKVDLTAQNTSWSMTSLQLKSGTSYTVDVTNRDGVEHNFSFKEANAEKDIEGGEDGSVTFTTPAAGSYRFFCKYHPARMTGTVTVT
jgi:plastocyanin